MTSAVALWSLLLAALAIVPVLYARENAGARRQRAGSFSESLALFDSYRVTMTGHAYPRLEGRYRGHEIRLELVLDDMAWRKLPSLWLKATIFRPNPERAVLDFLMRPQGQEFYSPSGDMVHRLPVPENWPQNAILCADRSESVDQLEKLTPHMKLFEDPRAKELVASPRGVRLVYQAAQAERAYYLVFRQARFATGRLTPELLKALLDHAIAIAASLDADLALPALRSEAA